MFAICGKEGLKKLGDFGLEIFLDLKTLDVPNTVKKTVASIGSLKTVKYLTIHTSGGYDMLKAAQEASGHLELLGVTVLTSQSASKEQIKILKSINNIPNKLINPTNFIPYCAYFPVIE